MLGFVGGDRTSSFESGPGRLGSNGVVFWAQGSHEVGEDGGHAVVYTTDIKKKLSYH